MWKEQKETSLKETV
jgi:hypothetical protein